MSNLSLILICTDTDFSEIAWSDIFFRTLRRAAGEVPEYQCD